MDGYANTRIGVPPAWSRADGAANTKVPDEESLLVFYMELTGCNEREARSTYMHVEPADNRPTSGVS